MTTRLSPQQRRVWARIQECGANQPYRAAGAYEICGAEGAVVEGALLDAIAAIGVLRTRYVVPPGEALAVAAERSTDVTWTPVVELRGAPAEVLRERMRALVDRASHEPHDPTRSAAIVATRIDGGDRQGLVVRASSLSADSATMAALGSALQRVLAREPLTPMAYADLAEWASGLAQADEATEAACAWSESRAAEPLPFDAPGQLDADFVVGRLRDAIDPAALATFADWCVSEGLALEHGLLAAWGATLGKRYARCGSAIPVTVWLDGRGLDDLRGAFGLLARVVPGVVSLDPAARVVDVARDVARRGAEMVAWQDYYADDERPSAGAAFEVTELPKGTYVRTIDAWAVVERFALGAFVRRQGETCVVDLGFDEARVTRAQAERVAASFEAILLACARSRDALVATLPALGATERAAVEAFGAGARVEWDAPELLHASFERRAKESPERAAVTHAGRDLTYGALDARANGVARSLGALGARVDDVVALFVDRSIEQVIAVYGIVKSGAAYLPIDPELPAERIATMLVDAGACAIVTTETRAGDLPVSNLPLVFVERTGGAPDAPRLVRDPDAAAYVIFTSGSTGRPKGVVTSHRAIANQMQWIQSHWPLSPDDKLIVKAPIGFDASVWEIFWPLGAGASLVVADPGGHRDPAYLAALAREHAVTTIKFVPAMLAAFLAEVSESGAPAVRRVLCGGEALDAETRRAFHASLDAELLHFYGPSEAAIAVTGCALSRDEDRAFAPLGAPVANGRLYVLDEHMRRVPFGAPGELYIGGACLARGYCADPGRTAERFLPDPFAGGGARMYRTGDVVVLHEDNALAFVGRVDHQVKLRGHRIELGEVEAHLRRIAGVTRAAAAVVPDARGERRLVGYVVATSETGDSAAIRDALRRSLPPAMVPSAVVRMDALPMTSSGKLDRKRLPPPTFGDSEGAPGHAPLATQLERAVAAVWSEVLGVTVDTRDAHFFELGGHSLLATQVVARIQRATGATFTLHDLFGHATVAESASLLAARLESRASPDDAIAPVAAAVGPLSYAQQRIYYLEQLSPGSPAFHVPIAVTLRGRLRLDALRVALDVIVERHAALRTAFVEGERGVEQRVVPHRPLAVPIVDLPSADDHAVRARVAELARVPFDLRAAPLVRPTLVRRAEDDHVLLLLFHHIATDDWSLGVIVREFLTLYGGQPASVLAPLPLRYLDYSVWQRRWMEGGAASAQVAEWRARLAGLPPAGALHADPDPGAREGEGALLPVSVEAGQRAGLEELARREGATLYMVLAATVDVLVHALTGTTDVAIGTPIANRRRVELEPIVGLFSNACVLRVDLAGDPSFRDVIARVRQFALAAYERQEVPFDAVLNELARAGGSRAEPFDVWFALQNAPMPILRIADVDMAPFDVGTGTAKFPLALLLHDHGGEGLTGLFEYATARIGHAAAARVVEAWKAIVRQVLDDAGATLGALATSARGALAARQRDDAARFGRGVRAQLSALRRGNEKPTNEDGGSRQSCD